MYPDTRGIDLHCYSCRERDERMDERTTCFTTAKYRTVRPYMYRLYSSTHECAPRYSRYRSTLLVLQLIFIISAQRCRLSFSARVMVGLASATAVYSCRERDERMDERTSTTCITKFSTSLRYCTVVLRP